MLISSRGIHACRSGAPALMPRLLFARRVHDDASTGQPGTRTPPTNLHSHSHSHSHSEPSSSSTLTSHATGHSHDHGHGHDHSHTHSLTGELLSTGKVGNPAVRITLVGFVTNIGMAVTKGIGGVVFNSQSLIADAIHAISDLVSDIMTLCTVSVARKAPSTTFPNGYGRIETVGAFGVSSMLLFAGVSMGFGSLVEITSAFGFDLYALPGLLGLGSTPVQGHAHHHKLPAEWNAAYIALASIAIKEALYQATRRVAERENSPVLLANAWHHRVDSLVSVVAVTSIAAGQLLQAGWVDPLGGLIVSGMVVRAGWTPAVNAVQELVGSVKPALTSPKFEEFESTARSKLAELAPGYEIVRCTLEPYGSTFVGSVQVKNVDGSAEHVAAQLKQRLLEIEHMRQVYVRI